MTNFNLYDAFGKNPQKSRFDLSHKVIMDYNMGNIVPFLVEDILPGDEIDINSKMFARMAPMVAPQMSDVNVNMRYFFVPYRILWKQWNEFYMAGDDTISIRMPSIQISTIQEFKNFYNNFGKLYRHFGLSEDFSPQQEWDDHPRAISMLPLRAYNQIFYWYYLASDLIENDAQESYRLKERFCKNDYVHYDYSHLIDSEGHSLRNFNYQSQGLLEGYYTAYNYGDFYTNVKLSSNIRTANLGTTFNEFKVGKSLQKFYDNVMLAKNRFVNYSKMLFGVAPNLEYDRPIYLGGSTQNATIGDILQTADTQNGPLGNYAGTGSAYSAPQSKFFAKEFGYLIGLIDITPKISYAKFEHERITKFEPLDFYRPEFENTYIHEVKCKHAYRSYATQQGIDPEATFGYTIPYNEYRFPRNLTLGQIANNLKYWGVLNNENVDLLKSYVSQLYDEQSSPHHTDQTHYWYQLTHHLFAVASEPQFFIECFNQLGMNRVVKQEITNVLTE